MRFPTVTLHEECMREGMQIESKDISVVDKVRLLDLLSETGLRNICVGSFVRPEYTPQMACIDEIVSQLEPKAGVRFYAATLNPRGVERAQQYPVLAPPPFGEMPSLTYSMCETFVQRNTNRTQQDQIDRWDTVVATAVQRGAPEASIGINSGWGSNFQGACSREQRFAVLRRQHALWDEAGIRVHRISLSDSMGWCMPHLVEEDLDAVQREWPEIRQFSLHLHDARGMALTSIYAAMRSLDERHELFLETTAGGIGGCPYSGNGRAMGMAATEDVVQMLEAMGIDTGVDLDKLIDFVWLLEDVIGRPVPGHVAHGGPLPKGDELYDANLPLVETHAEARHFKLGPHVVEHQIRPWKDPIPQRAGASGLVEELV